MPETSGRNPHGDQVGTQEMKKAGLRNAEMLDVTEDNLLAIRSSCEQGWRRGWDSRHRRVLKTKTLTDPGFLRAAR